MNCKVTNFKNHKIKCYKLWKTSKDKYVKEINLLLYNKNTQ